MSWLIVVCLTLWVFALVCAAEGRVATMFSKLSCSNPVQTLNYETDLLDHTIRRIISLLQVGFGEAGAQIIAQNMKVWKPALSHHSHTAVASVAKSHLFTMLLL